MEGSSQAGTGVASMLDQALLEGEFLGIERFYFLLLVIALLVLAGLAT